MIARLFSLIFFSIVVRSRDAKNLLFFWYQRILVKSRAPAGKSTIHWNLGKVTDDGILQIGAI